MVAEFISERPTQLFRWSDDVRNHASRIEDDLDENLDHIGWWKCAHESLYDVPQTAITFRADDQEDSIIFEWFPDGCKTHPYNPFYYVEFNNDALSCRYFKTYAEARAHIMEFMESVKNSD